jgi:hypothetical protein
LLDATGSQDADTDIASIVGSSHILKWQQDCGLMPSRCESANLASPNKQTILGGRWIIEVSNAMVSKGNGIGVIIVEQVVREALIGFDFIGQFKHNHSP